MTDQLLPPEDDDAFTVTVRLSQPLEIQENVKEMLGTWGQMMTDMDNKLSSIYRKVTDSIDVLCNEIEADNIRQFEIYRQLLRARYSDQIGQPSSWHEPE